MDSTALRSALRVEVCDSQEPCASPPPDHLEAFAVSVELRAGGETPLAHLILAKKGAASAAPSGFPPGIVAYIPGISKTSMTSTDAPGI